MDFITLFLGKHPVLFRSVGRFQCDITTERTKATVAAFEAKGLWLHVHC